MKISKFNSLKLRCVNIKFRYQNGRFLCILLSLSTFISFIKTFFNSFPLSTAVMWTRIRSYKMKGKAELNQQICWCFYGRKLNFFKSEPKKF